MPNKPLKTEKQITDYEMRVKAMTLATQHSRNCHSATLIKLADTIYDFLTGKPFKGKFTNAE
jgi:hypothetical protein